MAKQKNSIIFKGLNEALNATYQQLKKVRESKTIKLKPISTLKTEMVDMLGNTIPVRLRYYQVQGAFHMMLMKRMVLGDEMGLGKTLQCLTALAYLWDANPNQKVVILAPKSALGQWAAEVAKFTNGIRTIVVSDGKQFKQRGEKLADLEPVTLRERAYQAWLDEPGKCILIMSYGVMLRDWKHGMFVPPQTTGKSAKQPVQPGLFDKVTAKAALGDNLVVIADEAQELNNNKTQTYDKFLSLSMRADRVYGLTATPINNNLLEAFFIFKAIRFDLFDTKTDFMERFAKLRMQKMGKMFIPIIEGWRNLDEFRKVIDPFFLQRTKFQVSDELPQVINKEIEVELSPSESRKYDEALNGLLAVGDGSVKDYSEFKALVSLMYCQKVVNSLSLLDFEEGDEVMSSVFEDEALKVGTLSSKEETLLDLLENSMPGQKVVVFTRFASHVPRLRKILADRKIESVAITGAGVGDQRTKAREDFCDLSNNVRVIFITRAGTASLNLQVAAALVYYDLPWSWGQYLQTLGRIVRIGSVHKGVLIYHLMARTRGRKTIDHHTLKILMSKMDLATKVFGDQGGALEFDTDTDEVQKLLLHSMTTGDQSND